MADLHENEYNDNMTTVLELTWGKGFMAPGGEGNVHRIVDGLDLRGKTVLEMVASASTQIPYLLIEVTLKLASRRLAPVASPFVRTR